uniref:Uncharacterized protein n=1 Tax=Rhipicephalus appendiculatus TaxID=34631 RepID=A0A131YVS7_RHIAP
MECRHFPLPQLKLNRPQAVGLQLLQTCTYPTLYKMSRIYPELELKTVCDAMRNGIMEIRHVMEECPASLADPDWKWEKCMRLVKSEELQDQLKGY